MKKSKKKKNKKRIANNYLGMAAIAIVVLLLLGGLTYQSQTLKARIAVYDAKASALEDSIAGEQERTQEIDEQKEYMQTDEYIAEVARDKLGLVKGNEIVFEEEKYRRFCRKVFWNNLLYLTDILKEPSYNIFLVKVL